MHRLPSNNACFDDPPEAESESEKREGRLYSINVGGGPKGPQQSKSEKDESTDTSSDESDGEDWSMPDYVRMLLLNENGTRVLMCQLDGIWMLPRFTYPRWGHCKADRCCRDLQDRLGVEDTEQTIFTVVMEILGYYASNGFEPGDKVGFGCILLLEAHSALHELPHDFAWKEEEFLIAYHNHLMRGPMADDSVKHALRFMGTEQNKSLAEIIDPRYRYGWFSEASEWMRTVVENSGASSVGRVIQAHVTNASTILKLNSTQGWFYAKAPALGSNEASVADTLGNLFPNRCVNVVARCDQLRCFMTKEFEDVDIEIEDLPLVVRTLGTLQLESMKHVEDLRKVGCPDRTPAKLHSVLQEWAHSEALKKVFLRMFFRFEAALPHLLQLCSRLEASKIPHTLVHGDFEERNMMFTNDEKTELMLFDWEFSCISHPFCDMQGLDDSSLDEDEQLPAADIEAYRNMFAMYSDDQERLRKEYEAGLVIGKVLMMWSCLERMEACDVQENSTFGEMVFLSFEAAEHKLRELGLMEARESKIS